MSKWICDNHHAVRVDGTVVALTRDEHKSYTWENDVKTNQFTQSYSIDVDRLAENSSFCTTLTYESFEEREAMFAQLLDAARGEGTEE